MQTDVLPLPHKNEKIEKVGPKSEESTAAFHFTASTVIISVETGSASLVEYDLQA